MFFTPEPQRQFEPNLIQSILGLLTFKFVQMKGQASLQGEIIKNNRRNINEIKKNNLILKTTELISTKIGTKHYWMKKIQFHSFFQWVL